ncbi:hypothetical protein H310_14806 [Aphanomyces invadans]|uniref:Uncharacterized protein n=1 Tax=Aphanomyces invadans TaxID=157072 RepID=A0A024T8S8_9STRA|nr:hypothetical protein H310_14806 [Aphanomyces invadans]ETV90403.1 hypothetical protein H310_14806 [Aphanomyces invadans]|eukprot:XP_008880959.1 hypothetical protein H310_14806 [Aphanomyces invadans]
MRITQEVHWPGPPRRYKRCTQLHGVTIDQRLDVRRRVQLISNGIPGLFCGLKQSRSRFLCPSLRRRTQRPGPEDCLFLFQAGMTVRDTKVPLHGRPSGDLNLALQEVVLREPHLDWASLCRNMSARQSHSTLTASKASGETPASVETEKLSTDASSSAEGAATAGFDMASSPSGSAMTSGVLSVAVLTLVSSSGTIEQLEILFV